MYYLFAVVDDTPCAYAAAKPKGAGLYLSKLYVSAAHRGRGLATTLLDAICAAFPHHNDMMQLNVYKHNAGSIAAYQRMGFVVTDMVTIDIGNGYIQDDYIMQRKQPQNEQVGE